MAKCSTNSVCYRSFQIVNIVPFSSTEENMVRVVLLSVLVVVAVASEGKKLRIEMTFNISSVHGIGTRINSPTYSEILVR